MGVIDFEVLRAAEQISGDRTKALAWYRQPLPVFDHQTPQQLVEAGRKPDLLRYLQSLEAGWTG
ncbi:antitoxin Xre/MbcA/ParS toxin-binding domain-containing protein [Halomonas sp. NO4]|uniref:antitoxin Xre/MbcA/ParS toxin-binding domain-containing protein n=1 Tax=Halomonas sp. NO4 TaxID=2484813 RepID=UPI001F092C29|nr:antitoxin Xre/MbcA/ParS toxin-binding domain-containing protein [Halomonas sp. NO4]